MKCYTSKESIEPVFHEYPDIIFIKEIYKKINTPETHEKRAF